MRGAVPRWLSGAVALLALLAGACGSGDDRPDAGSAGAMEGAAGTDTTLPMADDAPPTQEALESTGGSGGGSEAESDIELVGATEVRAVAGEVVEVDHLVRNIAVGSRSATIRTGRVDDALEVALSVSSFRIGADEIVPVVSTVTLPDAAETGQVLIYEVVALNVDDISQRRVTQVRVEVVEATGQRPEAGDDAGTTTTNEKVLVFAVGDDTDPDGDLDPASMEVVAGGFLGDQVTAGDNGIITYVPFANLTGEDAVVYRICDTESRCDTAVLRVTITD